ncbi:hypothetical protein [Sphingomonas sanxanigenens]|uniref:Uncharacterized protein n=1 Tax=Sphingomonas sanxanigenens DSM 19645 = NX02 TaxID=1123269 RepID=W0ADF4_9SPHN|nr:hypothetical protein [Sphingomonas sanxanigenens]AHE55934.1 hypothetical protein NX02_21515 [Sphingomonas sanxanigenens DSM 19645 = NX02]
MRQLKERLGISAAYGSRAIRAQPNYHTEITTEYLDALQRHVDAEKPANFKLTPIGEPGW